MPMLTIFFPGLGADSTLAKYHRIPDGESLWIEWPNPIPETWVEFVDAMIRQIPSCRDLRFVGISFGGLAALATAQRLQPVGGLYLVGSLVDRSELRFPIRQMLAMIPWLPTWLFDLNLVPTWAIRYVFGIREPAHLADFRTMANRLPARSVKRLCVLVAGWSPRDVGNVHRIHGSRDRILQGPANGAKIIEGGHLISMTHSNQINAWLKEG
jgi:pimeloyl-ACP methyl ester carboxylesterase